MKQTGNKETESVKGKTEKSRQKNTKDTGQNPKKTKRHTEKRKAKKREASMSAEQGLHQVKEPRDMVLNAQVRDSGGKAIFEDNILCSQFLRDYIDLPCLKDVCPEDIEDVSEQYVTMFAQERNSDRVKRVRIRGGDPPFFLVSLIEHKTNPDYNVCMQIFRYMVYIWNTYEREAEQIQEGMSKREDFLYPPILPIVYYEGSHEWNVPLNFKSRIREGEAFGKYIPDFEYYLVPLREYSNEVLMEKRDEISVVMMINKLQTEEDVANFRRLPGSEIDAILKDTPAHLLDRIADVLLAFLLKLNVPVLEAEELTDMVREKKVAELFGSMQKMDIQAERRNTAREKERADAAQKQAQEAQKQKDEMQEESIKSVIELCREFGASQDITIGKLVKNCHLQPGEAMEKIAEYWEV